jgi:hypothetical protein
MLLVEIKRNPFSCFGESAILGPNASHNGSSLTPEAPAITGAFYFFNHPQTAPNGIQYLTPSPTSTANLEPLFSPK